MTELVHNIAESMPDHQSNRGSEFRSISVEERYEMAQQLIIARSQARNDGWNSMRFRRAMQTKKERYMHEAGRLDVDISEANAIWWSIVYDDPSPAEKNQLGLI